MVSASKKSARLAEMPYGMPVLLEQCPECGADVGERCKRSFGGRQIRGGPHTERVKEAKPKL